MSLHLLAIRQLAASTGMTTIVNTTATSWLPALRVISVAATSVSVAAARSCIAGVEVSQQAGNQPCISCMQPQHTTEIWAGFGLLPLLLLLLLLLLLVLLWCCALQVGW
jgi:hypothetical protein